MMRFLFFTIFLLLTFTTVNGQKYYVSNLYAYDLFLLNPAAAGNEKSCYSISGFCQKQWVGQEKSPGTQLLTFQGPLYGNLGMGTYLYNDQNGAFEDIGLDQSFSYRVLIAKPSRSFDHYVSIDFGLGIVGNQTKLNHSAMTDPDYFDPLLGGVESGWEFNANTGVQLNIAGYHVGFSVANLFVRNNSLFDSNHEPDLGKDIQFHVGGLFKIPGYEVYLDPLVMYRQSTFIDRRLDVNLKAQFASPQSDVTTWGLVGYRHVMDKNAAKSSVLGTAIGISYKNFTVGFEYQHGLTQARQDFGYSGQVVLGYKFCKKSTKHDAIPCSKNIRKSKYHNADDRIWF